jgi:ABC-type molybdenum transport system ATPase subunit/photorepair protein PhrA
VVFDGLSRQINNGEQWAVAGHNGSGKTTLLKLITGECLQVYANRIRLFGEKSGAGQTFSPAFPGPAADDSHCPDHGKISSTADSG